jgi:hypothetical protein
MLKIKKENEERILRLQQEKEDSDAAVAAANPANTVANTDVTSNEQDLAKSKSSNNEIDVVARNSSVASTSSRITRSADLSKNE